MEKTYKVKIESYDVNGYGVCHIDKKVVFVEKALKDEEVIIEITNEHKKYAFAKIVKILAKSSHRQAEACPYARYCGGCDFMHMDYETECEIKQNKVKQTLKEFNYELLDIIKNDNLYNYRNKIMVPVRKDEEGDIIYGFYQKMSHDVIPMDKCLVSNELSNNIVSLICRYLSVHNVSIYNETANTGLFKEVMVRNTSLNEYMVVLVTTADFEFDALIKLLTEEFKEIKSIYLNINSEKTNVVLSNNYKLLYGEKKVKEKILDNYYLVSPATFLQVNHNQCERLYSKAFEFAGLDKNMTVIDAYCGMGSITLNLARKAKFVYGIEEVPQAIDDANENMKLNGISNASFICGKCEDKIREIVGKEHIDLIVVDPPRKGCDQAFLDTVIKMGIPKIVYISCNVATLARDIKILESNGYKLDKAEPVDLFSLTNNIETVCLLVKK
ncbi:MAG: 23S rRNA (uracil(1939)-C(5))-methyltransferase RlmD [Acholeplasmatales bacterium]|nr:23S rRNA (uracil(1939)-C(5))-methyltransferase RlmD [Acholeplasmatales bacterium]